MSKDCYWDQLERVLQCATYQQHMKVNPRNSHKRLQIKGNNLILDSKRHAIISVLEYARVPLGSEWCQFCHQMVSATLHADVCVRSIFLWLLELIHQNISPTTHVPCRQTWVGLQRNITGKTTHQWCVWLSAVLSLCYYALRDVFMRVEVVSSWMRA